MKMNKHIYWVQMTMTLVMAMMPLSLLAQTVGWELAPTDYASIVRFGPNLYQVKQKGKIGLIHSDGTEVVPVKASSIGGFHEGLALVTLDESKESHRILGVLNAKGIYTPFSQSYYTLNGQEFYSDGVLSVMDANGKKGYIDEVGNVVCGFDKKYELIKPFTDGYAAVWDGSSSFSLINKNGRPYPLTLPEDMVGRTISYVYNPIGGKVLFFDDYGKCYKYSLQEKRCEKLDIKKANPPLPTDYLFRPKMVLENIDEQVLTAAPFTKLPAGKIGISPIKENGKFGFSEIGKPILPCQLDSATVFEDDLSIVSLGGKWGILKYYSQQQDFSLSTPQAYIDFDGGSIVSCQFELQVPTAWNGKQMNVTLNDKDTKDMVSHTNNASLYTFQLKPEHSMKKSYNVTVASEGLLLWTGELSYTLKKKAVGLEINSLVLDHNVTDPNYRVPGSFTIYNPNENEVTADISFTHSSMIREVGGYPKSVTLKSGERRRVEFYIETTNRRGDWKHTIGVSSSKGGATSLTMEVKTL